MRIRQDLILSRQGQREGLLHFVVKDPITRRFFRFKEPEEFIIRHLDGTHSQETIRKAFESRFEAELSAEALAAFIERLRRLGLLDDGTQAPNPSARRNLLYLRFKAIDPDRILAWLLPRTRLLFTRPVVWLSAALLLVALFLTAVHSGEIAREAPRLLSGSSLILTWMTLFAVGCTHEFAHGLACKRYGGDVREMGFMLLFFIPAFYCNVSDAWLFNKRQRLVVLFAGAYWQIVLWALATVAWRLTAPETFPHLVALIVMGICGIHTLLNLNPLIKLDGYYLLSDYLEIPNLRSKAFGHLAARIKRFWGAVARRAEELTPRERRIYVTYGVLAGTYSFSLLGLIVFRFGGFLTERYQGLGFMLFAVLAMLVFKNSMKKTFHMPLALFQRVPYDFSSFKVPATAVVLISVLALLIFGHAEFRVSGEFKVLPSHNADVRAKVDGIIEEIYVDEGDVVENGQLIARLGGRDYRSEIEKVEAEIAEKRARLKMLEAGPRREEVDLASKELETAKTRLRHASDRYQQERRMRAERVARATAAVEKAREQLNYSQTYLEMHQELFDRDLISRLEFDKTTEQMRVRQKELQEAEAALNEVRADDVGEMRESRAVAEREVSEAESKLELLLAGSRPEEIEATAAEVARLAAERAYAMEQLRLTELASPISGVVTTPKISEKLGQQVGKGDLVAEVYDLSSVIAEISISEKEIADIDVGDRVVLKARAYFQTDFEGRVVSIAPTVTRSEGEDPRSEKTIRVTTRIENPSLLLKPDMTGMAKVYCGDRGLIDIATRRLARYLRVEFWSWW